MEGELLDAALELSQQADQQVWWPFVGNSMSPYIEAGDMILVQHTLRPVRLGDVIVFRCSGELVAHRVVFVRKSGSRYIYRAKGDNSRNFDMPISQSSILGRVICVRKNDGIISLDKPRNKFFSLLLAFYSYCAGILYQAIRIKSSLAAFRPE